MIDDSSEAGRSSKSLTAASGRAAAGVGDGGSSEGCAVAGSERGSSTDAPGGGERHSGDGNVEGDNMDTGSDAGGKAEGREVEEQEDEGDQEGDGGELVDGEI